MLDGIAGKRNQSLAQMAIAWLLKDSHVTSVLIGASSIAQLVDNIGAIRNVEFTGRELQAIEDILT
jgi:L-glyceraldehyde 3-phosphate reductase